MSRPMYENEQTLIEEREVALILEKAWNCSFSKMPIRYKLDFAIHRNQKLIAFCEVKCRDVSIDKLTEWGGYLLALGKYMAAKELTETTKKPFSLIVTTTEGIYHRKFTEFNETDYRVMGRKDRDDWQDIEPCVLIPINTFKKVVNWDEPVLEKDWLSD